MEDIFVINLLYLSAGIIFLLLVKCVAYEVWRVDWDEEKKEVCMVWVVSGHVNQDKPEKDLVNEMFTALLH